MREAEAGAALLEGLDADQRAAVTAPVGPLLIVAGAGSGKTLVLTRRIAQLVASGQVRPAEVLAIAFTNKTARELGERVAALVGEAPARRMTVGTFHAVSHRHVVRPNAARLGRSGAFSIYDAHDARRLIAGVICELGLADMTAREAQAAISLQKARLVLPKDASARGSAAPLAAVWALYERALERSDALDFDDLIGAAVRLLSGHPELLATLRGRFRHVLVDEFQDVNAAQHRWLGLVAGPEASLTAVADDDQLVYSFRAADVRHTLGFERDFPGARVVALERNYRSSGRVVHAAGRLIAHNRERRSKRIVAVAPQGAPVRVLSFADEGEEARAAIRWCAERIARSVAPEELALLYRTRGQARPLEQALLPARLAYRVLGGLGFFEHAEVRDALAYLALVSNPRDRLAFERALQIPRRGLGPAAIARLLGLAERERLDLLSALVRAGDAPGLRPNQVEAASTLGLTLAKIALDARRRGVAATVSETVLASGLPRALRSESGGRAEPKLERLRELVRAARAFNRAGEGGLAGFLAQAALLAAHADDDASGRVTLATVHAAKGLEWRCVRVVGFQEELFPHARSEGEAGIEEERRLAYVAMTRAREELVLTWARARHGRPGRRLSRFATEAAVTSDHGGGREQSC